MQMRGLLFQAIVIILARLTDLGHFKFKLGSGAEKFSGGLPTDLARLVEFGMYRPFLNAVIGQHADQLLNPIHGDILCDELFSSRNPHPRYKLHCCSTDLFRFRSIRPSARCLGPAGALKGPEPYTQHQHVPCHNAEYRIFILLSVCYEMS
jgi:hypothetical protein